MVSIFSMGILSADSFNMNQLTGYNNLLVCLCGSAEIFIYNQSYKMKRGDLISANWDMDLRIVKYSEDFSIYYCTMSETFFYDVFINISGAFCDFTYTSPILRTTSAKRKVLFKWIEQIIWFDKNSSEAIKEKLVRNTLQNLFIFIDDEIKKNIVKITLRPMPRPLQILRDFGSLLEKNISSHHNVSFYADQLNISPYYLSTITSGIMKDSPKGLIDKQLILQLKSYLINTDLPLKSIAEKLNFEDNSYMNRYFKRHTSMTLNEFRKINK